MFVAACDGGYVRYRAQAGRILEGGDGHVVVEELVGETVEIEAALWRFVLDLDLVDGITAPRRPVDEPLRWRLVDPRRLRVRSTQDMLHVKLVDVATALEARGYSSGGELVLEVTPPPGGTTDDPSLGRWLLEAGPDGASCRRPRSGQSSDLVLDSAALGSLYLGGFAASTLGGASRVQETAAGKMLLADRLFGTRPAPLTTTGF